MNRLYPRLEIDLTGIKNNTAQILSRCRKSGIKLCAVMKAVNGLPEIVSAVQEAGVDQFGTSRIEHIKAWREANIEGTFVLLRIPGLSEISDTVRYCDISLQSERSALLKLEEECILQNRIHQVIIMADLGDLREGCWDKEEFIELCRLSESLSHINLLGIGVNLGCYGSIKPTVEKMQQLLQLCNSVEKTIGRKLDVVSGGATTSFPLVHSGVMPQGINHLRIGDLIFRSRGIRTNWKIDDMDYLTPDTIKLYAEIIEIKEKPSYPQGEFVFNAFGKRPTYEDSGMQRRGIIALGDMDVGSATELIPIDPDISIIGSSSDHCIIDLSHCPHLGTGDIVAFHLSYKNILSSTGFSCLKKTFVKEQ